MSNTQKNKTNSSLAEVMNISLSDLSLAISNLSSSLTIDTSNISVITGYNNDGMSSFYKAFHEIDFNRIAHRYGHQKLSDLNIFKSSISSKLSFIEESLKRLKISHGKQHHLLSKLHSLSINELNKLSESIYCEVEDEKTRNFLKLYINKLKSTKWLYNYIEKLDKVIKFIIFRFNKIIQRNGRFYFRRLNSFHFKNLDDYHDNTIISNLQFEVIKQPPVLISNNSYNEKKHFR